LRPRPLHDVKLLDGIQARKTVTVERTSSVDVKKGQEGTLPGFSFLCAFIVPCAGDERV